MTAEPSATSESVRLQGNERYKAGKLDEAVALYQEASKLAPEDAAPLSNLSSALFELAEYDACDEACNSALALLGNAARDTVAKQKIYARQVRARVALKKVDDAALATELLNDSPAQEEFRQCLEIQYSSSEQISDTAALHEKLISELPRYKPMLQNVPEYFVVGHDSPTPLMTSDLLKTGRDKISLMFAGVGDARNLHFTLIAIMGEETSGGSKKSREEKLYHLTLVDVKPAAIARNLIVFTMLDEIGALLEDRDMLVKL